MHHFCAGCWYVVQLVLDLIIYNQIIHKIIVENQQSTLKLLSSICRYLVIAIICCHVTMYTRRFTFQIFPVVQSFDCLFKVDHRVLPNCKFETKSFKKVFYFPRSFEDKAHILTHLVCANPQNMLLAFQKCQNRGGIFTPIEHTYKQAARLKTNKAIYPCRGLCKIVSLCENCEGGILSGQIYNFCIDIGKEVLESNQIFPN